MDKLAERLRELRAEYDSGRRMLAELEVRRDQLRKDLLRISGAIQVLREVLPGGDPAATVPQASSAG